jgi:hypothetical protein
MLYCGRYRASAPQWGAVATLRLPITSIDLQGLPAELCPNGVEGTPYPASPREGTLKPSHPRKVGEHEPDQDGEDALTGDTGKGEDDADENEGNTDEVFEDRKREGYSDRPGRRPTFGREVVDGNTHDEECDDRETCHTRQDEHDEEGADPGAGQTDTASGGIQEIDQRSEALALVDSSGRAGHPLGIDPRLLGPRFRAKGA